MIKVKESTLRTAAGEGMDEFLNVLTDAYLEAVGGQLTAEAMPLLNGDQHTLLAYRFFTDEMREGGFVQLIQNGYGGYIFGMLSGRWMKNGNHKICPSISPKKSWEGTVGGLLFSVGVSLIFWKIYAEAPFCRMPFQNLGTSIWWYITAGVVLGIGSLAGDLTESALKRSAGVKDSGAIIPGMGGVFDVLDSFIYNGALFIVLGMWKIN